MAEKTKATVTANLPDDGTGAVATKADASAPHIAPSESGSGVRIEFPAKKNGRKNGKKKQAEAEAPATKAPVAPAQQKGVLSPFAPPNEKKSRVKIFVWGDSGAGKTVFALQFPSPAVIDLDNGTDPYKDKFQFEVKKTTNVDEVRRLVEWLGTHSHPYSTLVIDPITILWESLQKKWSEIFLMRDQRSRGFKHEYYDMQPRNWQTLKSDLKAILRMLLALDMNVIVTARSKLKYRQQGDDYMVADGETFDGDKSLPYMFDTVMHLENDDGKRTVLCTKDRWNVFPTEKRVPLTFDRIQKYWAKMGLDAPAVPVVLPAEEEITHDAHKVQSTPEQHHQLRGLIRALSIGDDTLNQALAGREVKTVEELSSEQIDQMIANLKAMEAARSEQEPKQQ